METIKTRSKTQKSFPHGLENGSLTLSVFHSHRFYCYCEDSLCRGIRSQNMMVDSVILGTGVGGISGLFR